MEVRQNREAHCLLISVHSEQFLSWLKQWTTVFRASGLGVGVGVQGRVVC